MTLFYLDDSTGTVRVENVPTAFHVQPTQQLVVIGILRYDEIIGMMTIKAEKIIDKSSDPQATTLWFMEVMHIHRNVYLTDRTITFDLMNRAAAQG
ncbi:hypothetical protein BC829DRAFT_494606 [Chytridium lagenaria]|nr:hypothetical protein BC829DRAFT_494606 [Chytridium lagenaria]